MITAGFFDGAVVDALQTAKDWLIAQVTFTIDPMMWVYLYMAALVLACFAAGFFLPFKWARAGLGFLIALGAAFTAGARYMGQIKDAQISKLRKRK